MSITKIDHATTALAVYRQRLAENAAEKIREHLEMARCCIEEAQTATEPDDPSNLLENAKDRVDCVMALMESMEAAHDR